MATEVIMPSLGLTMKEGKIVKWHKKPGDKVEAGEVLFEVLTDKVTMEVEAQESGTLLAILHNEGETVPVQTPIALVGEEGETVPDDYKAASPVAGDKKTKVPAGKQAPAAAASAAAPERAEGERVKISPRAKKLALEKGIDYKIIAGTSEGGRIVERDVLAYLEQPESEAPTRDDSEYRTTPLARKVASDHGVSIADVGGSDKQSRVTSQDVYAFLDQEVTGPEQELEEPSQVRRIIAERMSESKFSSPHVYFNVRVDMTGVLASRKEIEEASNVKPSINDYIIKAVSLSIREHPVVNAIYSEEGILHRRDIGVGLAVAIDDGLIVPVVKDPDRKSLLAINADTKRIVEAARENKLTLEDLSGGTFTVSSLGMYGIDWFTAIINPGESAILAVGQITKTPVVENDEIVIRPIMKMTLSVDHRLIDGAVAAEFISAIRKYLEKPILLFL